MNAEPTDRSHRGRPLDTSRDAPILAATLKLLATVGYDRLSMDAVAVEAGAGKATLYRRWAGKCELVIAAVNTLKATEPLPDTGNLRDDLRGLLPVAKRKGHDEFGTCVMQGLSSALPNDRELFAAFQQHFVRPRTAILREVFLRAQRRGEIAAGRDIDLLVDVFPALMMHHTMLLASPPSSDFVARVIDDVLVPAALAAVPLHPTPLPPEPAATSQGDAR